jgi:hypothetical protein
MTADEAFRRQAAALRHRTGRRGLSDQQAAREHRAQAIFFPALAGFQARIRDAAKLSLLMEEDFRLLLDALDDHAPTQTRWDETLAEERA